MGALIWLMCGVAAGIAARLFACGRRHLAAELLVAGVVALVAGVTATALDFGGWREADWRAGAFAFLLAFGAIGAWRASRARVVS